MDDHTEEWLAKFEAKVGPARRDEGWNARQLVRDLGRQPIMAELLRRYAGCSLFRGLLRIHNDPVATDLTEAIRTWYRAADELVVFASSWAGDLLAVRPWGHVLLVDAFTGELLLVAKSVSTFIQRSHGDAEALVAPSKAEAWLGCGNTLPPVNACAGPKVPGFLGGKEAAGERYVQDLSVYWWLTAQLAQKAGLA